MGTKAHHKGPEDAFDAYDAAITAAGLERQGAANPYTSLNGWMTSFLNTAGQAAVGLSPEDCEAFLAEHDTELAVSYGSVMQGFPAIPDTIRDDVEAFAALLEQSHAWVATQKPKKARTEAQKAAAKKSAAKRAAASKKAKSAAARKPKA